MKKALITLMIAAGLSSCSRMSAPLLPYTVAVKDGAGDVVSVKLSNPDNEKQYAVELSIPNKNWERGSSAVGPYTTIMGKVARDEHVEVSLNTPLPVATAMPFAGFYVPADSLLIVGNGGYGSRCLAIWSPGEHPALTESSLPSGEGIPCAQRIDAAARRQYETQLRQYAALAFADLGERHIRVQQFR